MVHAWPFSSQARRHQVGLDLDDPRSRGYCTRDWDSDTIATYDDRPCGTSWQGGKSGGFGRAQEELPPVSQSGILVECGAGPQSQAFHPRSNRILAFHDAMGGHCCCHLHLLPPLFSSSTIWPRHYVEALFVEDSFCFVREDDFSSKEWV